MKKKIIILLSIFLSFLFGSCEKIKNDWVDGQGLIQIKGEYETFDNNVIIVEENNEELTYLLKNENKVILKSEYSYSSYHRWYLIYNEKGLWFYSGDIGSVYWKKKENDSYEQILLDKENILKYLDAMPNELKKDLEDWL